MEWLWLVAGTGWLFAFAALASVRRLSRRIAQLTELYWALKYEHGELKARIKTLAPTAEEIAASAPPVQQSFVPLSSLKRS
jgi:cell division protein FtsB